MRSRTWLLILTIFMAIGPLLLATNRNPKDYPQVAKVISFQRQPCTRQFGSVTRLCHHIAFELDGRRFTGTCFHCDPLMPGEKYPARLDKRNLVLYVIHQKSNGTWGQDNYSITDISSESEAAK